MPKIEVNDIVYASLYNEATNSTAAQSFKVTAVTGTSYEGGALSCDTADGWYVELSRKDLANLNLPEEISEITAYDISNNSHFLTGKSVTWRDQDGKVFDVSLILDWKLGHQLDEAQIAGLQAVAGQTDVES